MHFLHKLCLSVALFFWFLSLTGWFWVRVFKKLNKKYGLKIKFVKEDCWAGLHWNKKIKANIRLVGHESTEVETTWYLCLLPCLPIIWKTIKSI